MTVEPRSFPVASADGHRCDLLACIPPDATRSLLWLPALGVAARHYVPFAQALAERGVAVFLHEWRGHGSSSVRAGRQCDWGYRELLTLDLPASEAVAAQAAPMLAHVIGGHSLGGQLACCRLALSPASAHALWLVASGAPYWRAFPLRLRGWLALAYVAAPWLASARGALPGRAVGFGGNEARSLIREWARTGLRGRYAAAGVAFDLETGLGKIDVPVSGVLLTHDWMAPESSLRYLLDKLGDGIQNVQTLDAHALGAAADHFAWMKHPRRVVSALLDGEAAA
jgi:predicted alpha/beta hydrolase